MELNPLAIIDCWHKIEHFSPYILDNYPSEEIIQGENDLPWKLSDSLGKPRRYRVYLGVFSLEQAMKAIRKALRDVDEPVEETIQRTCFGEIILTQDGKYVPASLQLSTLPWAIGQVCRNKLHTDNWAGQFQKFMEKAHLIVSEKLGSESSTYHQLRSLVDELYQLAGWTPTLAIDCLKINEIHEKVAQVQHPSNNFTAIGQNPLNSFYIKELENIRSAVKEGSYGKALQLYLGEKTAGTRIDLNKDFNIIFEALSPRNIPFGRWPSHDGHALNLMQQTAVNLTLRELGDQAGLFSVNGPPGTGKTTLLRDIIAGILVNRASKLAAYADPNDAFKSVGKIDLNGYSTTVYLPDEAISQDGILVASSNNAAVENITAELPSVHALDPSYAQGELSHYLSEVAGQVLGEQAWGLIAVALGNSANRNEFIQKFWFQQNEDQRDQASNTKSMKEWLDVFEVTIDDWQATTQEYEKARTKVEALEKQYLYWENTLHKLQELHNTLDEMEHSKSISDKPQNERRFHGLKKKIQQYNKELEEAKAVLGDRLPKLDYHRQPLRQLLLSSPWITENLNRARAELFFHALQVHQLFIGIAKRKFRNNLMCFVNLLGNKALTYANSEFIKPLWDTFFLVIPVVSTTFASVHNMLRGLKQESIGWLIVDEAGQAAPQVAAGALWRARRSVIVGDPYQIEPVVTIPESIIKDLRSYYQVPIIHVSKSASVQLLADNVNVFGTYSREVDRQWIGCPLRVHRRCLDPMFSISNQIAYEDRMVNATPNIGVRPLLGGSRWIHVTGMSRPKHWVPAQGNIIEQLFTQALLHSLKEERLWPDLFIITPFKSVAGPLKKLLGCICDRMALPITRSEQIKEINNTVGTVHTFQGKQASSVIFCLGVDPAHSNVANWAAQSPNLLNVAVSRAKHEFIVVGDRDLWGPLPYFNVLEKFLHN